MYSSWTVTRGRLVIKFAYIVSHKLFNLRTRVINPFFLFTNINGTFSEFPPCIEINCDDGHGTFYLYHLLNTIFSSFWNILCKSWLYHPHKMVSWLWLMILIPTTYRHIWVDQLRIFNTQINKRCELFNYIFYWRAVGSTSDQGLVTTLRWHVSPATTYKKYPDSYGRKSDPALRNTHPHQITLWWHSLETYFTYTTWFHITAASN